MKAQVNETRYRAAVEALRGNVAMDLDDADSHADAILSATCPGWTDTELAFMIKRSVDLERMQEREEPPQVRRLSPMLIVAIVGALVAVLQIAAFVIVVL